MTGRLQERQEEEKGVLVVGYGIFQRKGIRFSGELCRIQDTWDTPPECKIQQSLTGLPSFQSIL